ncbi:hypothetical protein KUTeg_016014 [Tegillarca granosa]|uniref:Ig-like domain-containing protein n=1 Tax=Tegillarca granosa TaxID=220873 RepID=A0ABQ9EJM5_TEGGR|nr:hypothetical protein KUTeg_016014 [Tegillarca granosa]
MLAIIAAFAAILAVCQGATFTIAPYNTSAEIGGNGTIACIVTNLGSDSVNWKKKNGNSLTSLTFNGNVLADATKYAVTGQYNLTIMNVASSDEGTYQCVVGSQTLEAYFSPVCKSFNLPNNVSVYWASSPSAGNRVNATCKSTYSNPPANLRWYLASNDVNTNQPINLVDKTSLAIYNTENVLSSGYGDAVSNLPLDLVSSNHGDWLICEVEFDGYYDVMNYTMQINLKYSSCLPSWILDMELQESSHRES